MSDFDSRARKAADAVRRQIAENTAHHEMGIRRAQRSPRPRRHSERGRRGGAHRCRHRRPCPRGGGGGTAVRGGGAVAMTGPLKPFDTCDTALQYFKDQAPEYLIERAARRRRPPVGGAKPAAPTRCGALGGSAEAGSAPAYSKTNVQEAGVDEPDIVKTDGNRIVAVAQERVHLVGVNGGKMTLRKTLPDTDGSQRVPLRRPTAGVQRPASVGAPSPDGAGRISGPC